MFLVKSGDNLDIAKTHKFLARKISICATRDRETESEKGGWPL